MFSLNVLPSYKIVENSTNIIYLSINSKLINEIMRKIDKRRIDYDNTLPEKTYLKWYSDVASSI